MTKLIAATSLLAVTLAQTFPAAQYRYLETPAGKKPRVVITADPELDDNNSMIRYVLMSDGYQTEGLIYASSQFHWTGDGTGKTLNVPNREYNRNGLNLCPCTSWRWNPKERFIDDIVDAYEKAYPNLRIHSKGYPSPSGLRSRIKWGNVQFDGEMEKDTDGSNLIKSLLLDNTNEPIYLHAWGGLSTIARALKSIEEQYKNTPQWSAIRAKVISKAVIHPSGDQDNTGGDYIRPNCRRKPAVKLNGRGRPYHRDGLSTVDDRGFLSYLGASSPRRAASIVATSIFFIGIIASKARFASSPPAAIASASTRGVICQDRPQRSLHQPHWLSLPPLPTIAFQ